MAYGTHPATTPTHDVGVHAVTWTMSILGLIAAGIGLWFTRVDEGTLTLFNRTYQRSELADTGGPMLLIIGGAVATIGMMTSALRDYEAEENAWLVAVEGVLAAVGLAAFVIGVVLLF